MAKKRFLTVAAALVFIIPLHAQPPGSNAEDKLQKDSTSFLSRTFIGGYGNAFYQRDFNLETSTINLERFVLFVGHKFNRKISFFSELEVEDAKVEGGEPGGEIALEQVYLKFNFNQNHYIVAGLFIPRLGILNENHLPTDFNGNERTQVETLIIPSTWRELGIGFYGNMNNIPLHYSIGIMNGLNAEGFEHGTGIREGRFEGQHATANNLAVTGSLQWLAGNFKIQASGYYGGSVGLAPQQADSLQLTSGIFGTPVILGEADIQYASKGFSLKVLGVAISIPDAGEINRAYASNTPSAEYGFYAEAGYNLFERAEKMKEQQLNLFIRYEKLNVNASIPSNGIEDGTLDQQHIIAGLSYFPTRNVVVNADLRVLYTGEQNPDLIINPSPVAPPYEQNNTFLNLGLGFSF